MKNDKGGMISHLVDQFYHLDYDFWILGSFLSKIS